MQRPREHRWPCAGRVNLIIDAAPWKLRTCARAVNVSFGGICLRLDDPRQQRKTPLQVDLAPLVREGHVYELQLENENPEARAQLTRATLVHKIKSGDGFILGFRFASPPPEIHDLVGNLAAEYS